MSGDPSEIPLSSLTIEKELSRGAEGVVSTAIYAGVRVCVSSEDHRGLIAIFKKEAELLRSLKHPNVVQYMGAVYERGKLRYMMTEYANGGSLEGWLKKQHFSFGGIELGQLLLIATWIMRGLAGLHSIKVIHRDLKAANVLAFLSEDDDNHLHIVKLADVGLARVLESTATRLVSSRAQPLAPAAAARIGPALVEEALRLTCAAGTPFYRAPELKNGARYDEKVDVFSFGILLGEIVLMYLKGTGAKFEENPSTKYGCTDGRFLMIQEACNRLTFVCHELAGILRDCCNASPADRPPALSVLSRLEAILAAPERIVGRHVRTVAIHGHSGNTGLAINPEGTVMVVSDASTHKIAVYRLPDGALQSEFSGPASGPRSGPKKFKSPQKLCFSPATGNLLIADWGNKCIQEMTLEGAHTRTIGSGDLVLGSGARSDPIDGFVWGIAANAAVVVVGTMSETKRVTMFELSGGFPVLSFGVKGVKEGELDGVSGIRFTRDGSHLLIAEDYGHRVSLFTLKGTFVRCIGVGTLRSPSDVCPTWTRSGDIAVADRDNHCIRVYSADGSRLLQTFGRWGRGPGELMCPTALATHGKQLFVLSLNSASVQVFE